jgi:hypothetical protein
MCLPMVCLPSLTTPTRRVLDLQEAEQAQEEALKEESNYHYFVNLTEIAQASLERVKNEEKWSQVRTLSALLRALLHISAVLSVLL